MNLVTKNAICAKIPKKTALFVKKNRADLVILARIAPVWKDTMKTMTVLNVNPVRETTVKIVMIRVHVLNV